MDEAAASYPSPRRYLRGRGIRAVIPAKADQPRQRRFDKAAYRLLGGRMADLLGRRRMLLTGLTLFSSASLVAGLAGSAGLLS